MVLQPKIIYHLAGIFSLALVFYLLIPGIGAFRIRNTWRNFRALLLRAALLPPVRYKDVRSIDAAPGEQRRSCRFFGRLQAMQEDNTVWLSDGEVSLLADLSQVYVYILSFNTPITPDSWSRYPAQPPQRVKWEKISSLPEETKIFISGGLVFKDGHAVFVDTPDDPLCVLIYEWQDSEVLLQGAWNGRQKNEYWNSATPGSLTLGFFSLFIYFYILMRFPPLMLPALLALSLSCIPFAPLLPPGIIAYYFYRRFWQQGRVLRAQRDILRLPLVFFSQQDEAEAERSITLSGGEVYAMRQVVCDEIPAGAPVHWIVPAVPSTGRANDCVFFGSEGPAFERPMDPMAEAIAVPGDPFLLSRRCQVYAMRKEILGLLILLGGIGITEFMLFVLFSYLVL
ncbi:MAG: hypothetical protein ACP5IA_08340 [Sediminispirochaetaceae bacterium]